MDNTPIAQHGATGTRSSRDTRIDEDQRSDEQKRKQQDAPKHGVGPSPGRPANAPERVPGQQLDPNDAEDVKGMPKNDEQCDRDLDDQEGTDKDLHHPRR
ncbi:hypothetical protein EC912_101780 [Luteibacter rhizovicinus]|uniref:Uncharacterized protein n=1 Tax=Luteibacter rhizovicinus TaxID=242606 RepID=A0A4R3Z1T8_9GAMM|nr:hypothetical protein [Luteibacter rhizovicinus]TCV97763.1 hypothetical protein EC912_101780 [Luteibacter rhizovicinus]